MSRHPEPDSITDYKRLIAQGPPKCCHSCEFYDVKGKCVVFFMAPPADFAATVGECPEWVCDVPF
jgi:hypothetical protein